ncbi:ADP-ribosyl-[dinitrogen reductase] glycohydrolase-like [Antedon mediterranea]|uniref:ADP-ribosyl-[dinitrogen reductase] glycohydrolase-like n=1 Tax=Antedon mediterranea TaxID=105859 RepID=UPI003AF5E9B0
MGQQQSSLSYKTDLENKEHLKDHILGAIYGNCIGDAIGLLTEFMTKEQAEQNYTRPLEYTSKTLIPKQFMHQHVFPVADWTDDSDQMILIMHSLTFNKGKAVAIDFAKRLDDWATDGFKELGDTSGMGVGRTTNMVMFHESFLTNPHKAAKSIWELKNKNIAPNGGVMRTSILGICNYGNMDGVIQNTLEICRVTHADPRCQASCVAVTTAIAMMLQGKHFKDGNYDVRKLCDDAYEYAKAQLPKLENGKDNQDAINELRKHMFASSLKDLELARSSSIGYTYKCLGAGFWGLRQDNFRDAIECITMEAGDADTNGAVAGALLGCKLGASGLPASWQDELKHREWLDTQILNFIKVCRVPIKVT